MTDIQKSINDDSTVDLQVLMTILKNLVTLPEKIKLERKINERGVVISIMVDSKDMGIVIGRNGSMANTIKTLMKAVGRANEMNLIIEFREPDGSVKYNTLTPKKITSQVSSSSLEDDLKDFVIN
jgi:uncharacterized protein